MREARKRRVIAYLTRRSNGLYMLTFNPPVITNIGHTKTREAYPVPGDALNFINICPWVVKVLWGLDDIELLSTVMVAFHGEVLDDTIKDGTEASSQDRDVQDEPKNSISSGSLCSPPGG